MCGSGAGISMAPAAASAAAAGSTPLATALSPFASMTPRCAAVPSTVSGLPAVYETGTQRKVRRMKAEVKKNKDYLAVSEGQSLPLLETLLKPKTDLLNVLSIHNHEK